jgi:hypothetical protein
MKKAPFTVAIATLALNSVSFAHSKFYAVTNDDNPPGNTATVFESDGVGPITVTQTLHTGGTGLGTGYFATNRIAIENNGNCLFVSDAGSISPRPALAQANQPVFPSTRSPIPPSAPRLCQRL